VRPPSLPDDDDDDDVDAPATAAGLRRRWGARDAYLTIARALRPLLPRRRWVVVNVDASESGAKPKAVVGATGDTNLAGLKAQLRDDAMQFGCFKVLGVDQKGAVTSTRLKVRA
jgi:hypothetical protein